MSIDHRTRRLIDIRPLSVTEVLDTILPEAIASHGDLAARGIAQRALPAIGFFRRRCRMDALLIRQSNRGGSRNWQGGADHLDE